MKEILDLSLADFIAMTAAGKSFGNELIIREMDHASGRNDAVFFPVRLDAYSTVLVVKGEMTVEMDCRTCLLTAGSVLEMGLGSLVERVTLSPDCKGYHILVTRDLMKEVLNPLLSIFPSNTIKLKYLFPSRILEPQELDDLTSIIHTMQKFITDKEHLYRKERVKNQLAIFLMELNNSLWKRHANENENLSGYRTLKERFRQLLMEHCKEQHEVSFYAEQLCVTPDHLSKVMRNYSGRPAIKWINHALVTEAKILLRKPDLSIQKVAELLHFSDQSAFGKFFKKQTGISPLAYKKGK